jgi:hypothetical protein
LHAWRKEEKASKATPATPLVGYGVARMLEHRGFLRRAASLAAGYDGLMRGTEMASFRFKDVTFCHKKAIIKLAFAKTLGYRRADSELALISHPLAIRLLRKAIRSCAKDQVSLDEPVCACSVSALRAHVMRLLDELQLNNMGFSLQSWRRGAATAHFLKYGNLEKTMLAGRWSNAKVARDYISEATANLADIRMPRAAKLKLRQQLA